MKNFFESRGFLISLTAVVVGVGVYLAMPKPQPPPDTPKPKPTTDNCITITRDQIVNAWLDAGWGDPTGSAYIPSIMFEPVPGDPIKVYAYPVNGSCQAITAKKIEMTILPASSGVKCSFPATDSVGKVRYDFTAADRDAWGDLIDFSFVRLIPKVGPSADPSKTKLAFDIQFVKIKGDVEAPVMRGDTKPCPPYCPVARE